MLPLRMAKTKVCGACGRRKAVARFGKRAKSKDGLNAKCKDCYNEYLCARRRNSPAARAKQRKWSRQSQIAFRLRIRRLKEASPCKDCGQSYPGYVMQFDHRPGEEKKDNVASLVRCGKVIETLAEIEKCDLVCANCHFERTHQRRKNKVP